MTPSFFSRFSGKHMFIRLFMHMALRSSLVNKRRARRSIMALAVAATVGTAVLTLYADLESKLSTELRKFGANIIVKAKTGDLSNDSLQKIVPFITASDKVVAIGYIVAKFEDGTPIVIVGADNIRDINTWSIVASTFKSCNKVNYFGERAAHIWAEKQIGTTFLFEGRKYDLECAKIFKSGDEDEDRIFISLVDFKQWTGHGPSTLLISATGNTAALFVKMQQITNALPHSTVQPMRQNVAAEEQILGHTRGLLYLATIVISLLVAMSVLTTLTASVIERRKDFAVMKALGASQRELMSMFLFEAVTQAAIGGLAGYILGTLVAAWIGKANFGAIVSPQLQLFIPVLAGTLLIAALSALLPLNILRHVEPAAILKGE